MNKSRSVEEMLARLEAEIAHHRERAAFHAEQQAHHAERSAHHTAELETLSRHLEVFQETAAAVSDLPRLPARVPIRREGGRLAPRGRPKLARLVGEVLAGLDPAEPFGRAQVTAEINRRFAGLLRKSPTLDQVSDILRWMARTGRIHQVRPGRPRWEALYTRQKPGA
jgi:hypothetical protein